MSSPEQPPAVLPSFATSYGEEEDARCERILAPNCFGDNDKHNLWYLMLDQDVCRI
jgi:hypothetical protein